jgi:hypothetical protein
MSDDELTLVDCAGCGIELLGERCESRIRETEGANGLLGKPGLIAIRKAGRPYCRSCAATRKEVWSKEVK